VHLAGKRITPILAKGLLDPAGEQGGLKPSVLFAPRHMPERRCVFLGKDLRRNRRGRIATSVDSSPIINNVSDIRIENRATDIDAMGMKAAPLGDFLSATAVLGLADRPAS